MTPLEDTWREVVACCGSATEAYYCKLLGHACARNSGNPRLG
jgi:hypothetical protein